MRVPADARPGTVAVLRGSAGGAPFAIALPVVQPFQLVTTSIPAVAQAGESLPVSLTADTPFRGDGLRLTASVGAGTSPVSAVLDRAQSLLLHFPVPADAAGQVTVSATAEAAGQSQTFGRTVTVLPPEAFPAGLGPVGALVRFGSADTDLGLEREDVGDGLTEPCTLGGQACRQVKGNAGASYLYLRADRGFLHDTDRDVRLAIQYWDAAAGAFSVQYDSALPIGPFAGSYRPGPEVTMDGAGGWKVATVTLPDARFSGRQNGGADFRLAVQRGTLAVAAVYVLAQ